MIENSEEIQKNYPVNRNLSKESSIYVKYSTVTWTFFVIMWITSVGCLFFEYGVALLCLDSRCPETFWMLNNTWYKIDSNTPHFYKDTSKVMNTYLDKGDDQKLQLRSIKYSQNLVEWEYSQDVLTNLLRLSVDNVVSSLNEKLLEINPKNDEDTGLRKEKEERAEKSAKESKIAIRFAIFIFMVVFNGGILLYSLAILINFYSVAVCQELCMCNEKNCHDYGQWKRDHTCGNG